MADPVYDNEKSDPLDSLTPEAIRNLEDQHSSKADEREDQAIERGADSDSLPKKGTGRKLRERSEAQDADERENLNSSIQKEWQTAKDADNDNAKSLWKSSDSKGQESWFKRKKRLIFGLGLGMAIVIGVLVFFLGFLNIFKLDDMMSNIDLRTFSRFNAATSGRSDKWVQTYFFLRLTQLKGGGADPDSEYFRAQKVDTNNPVRDWYRTMRTSNFELDLKKKGIVFANRDAGNGVKFAVLEVNGTELAGLTAGDVRNGALINELRTNPDTFIKNKLPEIDLTAPGGNKLARQQIKQVVNDVTRSDQVLKRRQVRKAIQNMTGVKDWKFFETTRDKVNTTKINIRDKILTAAIPADTKAGKFVRCFFGITSCTFSEDPVNPQNDDTAVLAGDDPNHVNGSDPVQGTDANGNPVTEKTTVIDYTNSADVLKSIISKISGVVDGLNLISTLDLLAHIDKAITNHDLSKGVAVARGIQAMGLYQVFETARDQMKTGEVTGAEVNQFMGAIGPIANSEGWTKVLNGQGNPSQLTNNAASKDYCSPKNQTAIGADPQKADSEFTYLCADKQISGSNNATALESAFNNGPGQFITPIVKAYEGIRNAPIIGQVINLGEKIIGSISGEVASVLISILGIKGDLQTAIQYMVVQAAAFLGAGPIQINGAGDYMNWALQGGAYSAEASSRTNGASLTTPASKVTTQATLAAYTSSQAANESSFQKYLSLSNPQSPASNVALSISEFKLSSLSSVLNPVNLANKTIGSFGSLFSHRVAAGTIDGYAASNFAGIQTFDYPSQCYNLNPLTQEPQDGTNIQQIFAQYGGQIPVTDLTWTLVSNSTDWYAYIYNQVSKQLPAYADNPDPITEQIYNCNLLDNAVRGGLGYVYGYTQDNGLN